MIKTAFTEVMGIEHPIALGGLGGGHTNTAITSAVSKAGGLGALGCHALPPKAVTDAASKLREETNRPFALNFLLFAVEEEAFRAALDAKPPALAFAWPRGDQDILRYVDRARDAGAKVIFMVNEVAGAVKAVEAGADVVVAQGTEGGGHVGWMASLAFTPLVVDAVAPTPVLTAGGVADGRGLAASLALGADGVLLGTRFLASDESPLHANFKQAILDSDGHDTLLTEIPDIAAATVWPGAMSRSSRNAFIERWAGREWALRQNQGEVLADVMDARKSGNVNGAPLSYGQDAGLIDDIVPAGELVTRIAAEAEEILRDRLPTLVN